MSTQSPAIRDMLEPYLDSVFSTTPHFKDIPTREEDMEIQDKPGMSIPRSRPLRRLSQLEDAALNAKLDELLDSGFIKPSSSSYGSAVLFARKPDGSLRLCIDYRAVNDTTVRDLTPLPSHAQLRDQVQGAKFLSKIDIRDAFHMLRIKPTDTHKTAFKTKRGLFEYTVCPFGLTNSPAAFMRLMNSTFGNLDFLIYSVDDVLIFSKTMEEHVKHLDIVFSRLREAKLRVKLDKCDLAVQELSFCGITVSIHGIALNTTQVAAMCEYPQPKSAKDVQKFMGSVRFFAEFIPDLAETASILFDLTKKDTPFVWTVAHQTAMRVIQHHLSTTSVLRFFDPTLPTHVHTDASQFAIGGWLGQTHHDGVEYVVTYWSRRMLPAERNYPVHEQEFLALHDFIIKHRMYLHGIQFTAHVDHRAMEHLQTQPNLSPRQVRWITTLQEFMPDIQYIKGELNTFADWLSRRPDFAQVTCPQCHIIVKSYDGTPAVKASTISVIQAPTALLDNDLLLSQPADAFILELEGWQASPDTIPPRKRSYASRFSKNASGVWLYRNSVPVIPADKHTAILDHFHSRLDHGHFGYHKTLDSIQRYAYWPSLVTDVREFVNSCTICQRNLITDFRRQGLLHPLPVPDSRFQSISIDFGDLPLSSDGFNRFMVVQDRFSKLLEIIPCTASSTALEIATLLYNNWYLKGYGFPTSIVSDRDSRFMSATWEEFSKLIGFTPICSVSRHQQTNGGAESMIKMFKHAVRRMATYNGTNWNFLRTPIQFSYNNSIHSSTGFRPFYLAHAFTPHTFPSFNESHSTLAKQFDDFHNNLIQAHINIHQSNVESSIAYDKSRREPHPFKIGDYVWLHRDGIEWPADALIKAKMLSPFLGPFEITCFDEDLNNATLKLPTSLRIHPVFHASSLKPWRDPLAAFPERTLPANTQPPIRVRDMDEYEVESILDFKTTHHGTRFKFLVRWHGYDRSHDSWETPSAFTNCVELLQAFLDTTPSCLYQLPVSRLRNFG
jgi:hypothetical protein